MYTHICEVSVHVWMCEPLSLIIICQGFVLLQCLLCILPLLN